MRTFIQRSPLARHTVALATGALLLLTGLVCAVAPANADAVVTLNAGSGTVGVSQTVSATVSTGALGSPSGTITFTANGQNFGSQSVGGDQGGKAQVSWIPVTSGGINLQASFTAADGTPGSDSRTVQISTVGTSTSISTPGTAATSATIPLTAAVRSRNGQYIPTGTVIFYLNNGTAIGSSSLDGSGKASINYQTPASAGTINVYASYSGDANANTSSSSTDSIRVSAQAANVSLIVPQTNYVNTAVQLTAKINPTNATGTVDFSVDGKYLGTDKVASGVANLSWVPNALGKFTLTAKYSGGGGVNAGTASNSVQVTQQLKADQITVDPAGSAGPWVPGSVTPLANGASVTLNTSAASGQPVQLAVAGPCSLSGNVLKVDGVGGACVLTASTNGGNGYAPASQKYSVGTGSGAQTANITAPPSGAYRLGTTIKLGQLNAVTNVNQPIAWKVTSGGKSCTIVQGGGFYKLKLKKKGSCNVQGSAPAIPGQWAAFAAQRTYRVR